MSDRPKPGTVELAWTVTLPFWARRSTLIIVGGLSTIFVVTGILTGSWVSVVLALGVLVVFLLPSRRAAPASDAKPGSGGPDLDYRLQVVPGDGLTLHTPSPGHVAWANVTRVELTAESLVFTTRAGRKDILVVPASALTPQRIDAIRAIVEANAPGRFVESPA